MAQRRRSTAAVPAVPSGYGALVSGISGLLEHARHSAARAVNGILTATYWEVGRRVIEFEQAGQARADYGERLIERLARDLTAKHGRGFSERNVWNMKAFYLGWEILQTVSAESQARTITAPSICQTVSGKSEAQPVPASADVVVLAAAFPLPWSHYVRLLSVENANARRFYEAEAIRGGWSIRQLDRQIDSQFYE